MELLITYGVTVPAIWLCSEGLIRRLLTLHCSTIIIHTFYGNWAFLFFPPSEELRFLRNSIQNEHTQKTNINQIPEMTRQHSSR